jgi:hypothetical protein
MKLVSKPTSVSRDVFVVPVSGFFADPDEGVGVVHLPDAFHAAEPQARLKIIADWQRELAAVHARAFVDLYQATMAATAGLAPALRRQAFSQACRGVGQTWPPEVAAMLQRDLGTDQ